MMKLFCLLFVCLVIAVDAERRTCSSRSVCVPSHRCMYNGHGSLKWCDEERTRVCCPNSNLKHPLSHGSSQRNVFDFYESGYNGHLSHEARRVLRDYNERECGVRRNVNARVSTGHDTDLGIAKYGEFPWQVAILLRLEKDGKVLKYICGGTVISPLLVLTAAHCVTGVRTSQLSVKLGEWNLIGTRGELFPTIQRDVKKIMNHEYYNSATFDNDISILVLDKAVNLRRTPHVSPICLPPNHMKFDEYSKCFIAGWGSDIYKPNYGSNILKIASVTLLDDDCRHKLKESIPSLSNTFLNRKLRCISGSFGKDACIGDGGGAVVCPLSNEDVPVCENEYRCKNEHYFIAGLISWGSDECGEDGSVTVVTDIQSNWDWLVDKLRKFGGVNTEHLYSYSYDSYEDYGHKFNDYYELNQDYDEGYRTYGLNH